MLFFDIWRVFGKCFASLSGFSMGGNIACVPMSWFERMFNTVGCLFNIRIAAVLDALESLVCMRIRFLFVFDPIYSRL